jgi:hypothetical protein
MMNAITPVASHAHPRPFFFFLMFSPINIGQVIR